MDAGAVCKALIDGHERRLDEKLYLRWMLTGACSEVSFDMYKLQLHRSSRSTKEVLKEVFEEIETFNRAGFQSVGIEKVF